MENKNCTLIWGILNLTLNYNSKTPEVVKKQLLAKAARMISDGANVIDIGFEDSPHYQNQLRWQDEWLWLQNILPDLYQLAQDQNTQVCLSSSKYQTLEKALSYIDILNSTTSLQDPHITGIVREAKLPTIVMHNASEQSLDSTIPAILNIEKWINKKIKWAQNLKINPTQLIFNPAVGVGKTYLQSINIIQNITSLYKFNLPILVDHSRKGFLKEFGASSLHELDFNTGVVSMYLVDKQIHHIKVDNLTINKTMISISQQVREDQKNQQSLTAYFQRYLQQQN
jgi:dihydropteroate synthase